jgi:hypothetical protein
MIASLEKKSLFRGLPPPPAISKSDGRITKLTLGLWEPGDAEELASCSPSFSPFMRFKPQGPCTALCGQGAAELRGANADWFVDSSESMLVFPG